MISLDAPTAPMPFPSLIKSEIETGGSKIWRAVAEFFSEPTGIGVLSFIATAALGVVLMCVADSNGMQTHKAGRITLKIAAIAAFILSGMFLASGIIFGIV